MVDCRPQQSCWDRTPPLGVGAGPSVAFILLPAVRWRSLPTFDMLTREAPSEVEDESQDSEFRAISNSRKFSSDDLKKLYWKGMKPESSTATLSTKSKVKGFSIGVNALDAEMSQMGHYDEDFHHNYYPNVEYVDNYDANNQGKRKFQPMPPGNQVQSTQEIIDANKLKKRFVWPESLHRDFVSAVFDIGLKNSTSKLLLQMLPQSKAISTENLKSHLQKFRIHRDRSRGEYASYYELSTRQVEEKFDVEDGTEIMSDNRAGNNLLLNSNDGDVSRSVIDPSIAAVVESNLRAALEKSYILEHTVKLKVQIDSIANYIAEQTAFLASLKNSISKQSRLHNQLMAKLSQLDPSCISGNDPDNGRANHHQSNPAALSIDTFYISPDQGSAEQPGRLLKSNQRQPDSSIPPVCTARAELQIMSEMRSHMDMHRQLLMRKENQISRHNRGEDIAHHSNGPSHANCNGNNNGTWGDREPTQGDDHSLVYPSYSHANPPDCELLLMGSTVANPTALEADRTSPQSETDGQGQGQGQEGTYTDTSKSGYPVTDDAPCNQSLSTLKHPTHNTQVPHFAREQPGYLYNMRGNHISDNGSRGVLESPAGHTQCKSESASEMKGFPPLNAPNINLINYNINLQSVEGGALEGYNQGQGQGQGQAQGHDGAAGWHGNPHNPAHSHLHSHTLQPDLGGLPLSHRQQPHPHQHHHQTSEGKVAAHSEGLNAADWNWDAEYSLDHNLFAFLLDHNRDRSSSE